MDQKEANTPVPPTPVFSDRSVILKLLAFLGQLSSPQSSDDESLEQINLSPVHHSQ
jgi:hypothetical protein